MSHWREHFQRLDGAYAASTMRSYFCDVEQFEMWCQAEGVDAFPCSVEVLCRFIEEDGRRSAPSTVRRRVYAIRKAHRLMRLPDPTHDEDINLALRRVRRAKLSRPKQAKGITGDILEKLLAVQPETPWGLRDAAMLSMGYDLLTRRSELVALRTSDVVERGDGTLRVMIRRSKADPFGMGRIAFTSRRTADCVARWLDWRGPSIDPLFCGIYQGKPIDRSLEATFVKRLIKQSAREAGLDPEAVDGFSGHSLRVEGPKNS
ncbi:MAG: integrase [Rhodobacter sp. CACIA14H1]|nr:MAG: integrase [Rhodobacter sp. CACIA14H1]